MPIPRAPKCYRPQRGRQAGRRSVTYAALFTVFRVDETGREEVILGGRPPLLLGQVDPLRVRPRPDLGALGGVPLR